MVLQGLLTFASSLVIGAVAIVGICYTMNYVQNRFRLEDPMRPPSFNRSSSKWNGNDCSDPCTICMDPITDHSKRQLPCGHLFHINCIANWVKHTKLCPNCRGTVG